MTRLTPIGSIALLSYHSPGSARSGRKECAYLMDCSQFGDDNPIPANAHAALQYISHHKDKRNVYRKTGVEVANYVGCTVSEALTLLTLLVEVEAVERPEFSGITVHRITTPCVCQERLGLPRENRTKLLEDGSSDSSAASRLDNLRSTSNVRSTRKGPPLLDTERVETWNSGMFAYYLQREFAAQVESSDLWRYAGNFNLRAVATHVAKWKKNKVENKVIKGMIDTFCSDPSRWVRDGQPIWKSFIYNSVRLQSEVSKKVNTEFLKTAPTEDWLGAPSLAAERMARHYPAAK